MSRFCPSSLILLCSLQSPSKPGYGKSSVLLVHCTR